MVALQMLNYILQEKDFSIVDQNGLTEENFLGYAEEFNFIKDHYRKYKTVPDDATVLDTFPELQLVVVEDSPNYLLDKIWEETNYHKTLGILNEISDTLKVDSHEAVRLLQSRLADLKPRDGAKGVDLIKDAGERFESYNERLNGEEPAYIPTGFQEMDEVLNGWSRGEELAVIFARTNQGKSWILVKTLAHAWEVGYNVGMVSPEMTADKLGYRFDTLHRGFSNTKLVRGEEEPEYEDYIKTLSEEEGKFIVTTPADFNRKVTVTALKAFVEMHDLDILGIDGLNYMDDERRQRGDSKTITLTNISEDLMALSQELKIPIIVVTQANRQGVRGGDEGTPDLENIRDSDGIAYNATKIISLRQTGAGLELSIKKHRDGAVGDSFVYYWDIDQGYFTYHTPSMEDFEEMDADELGGSF